MKICIVGKYPPIEGGVSARTYRYAHGLARRGHEVHVVTNAREVRPPFRMFMREEDWARCEAGYGPGSVRVHWTDPPDHQQAHIPMASAFVTKLASLGIAVASDVRADAVFSYYAEPYAVAGYLVAEACGLPHLVRTAGSDAGRLWSHAQFRPLYDQIFRSADAVIAGGPVAAKMIEAGVDPARIFLDRDFTVPEDLFHPDGPALDVDALARDIDSQEGFAPGIRGTFRGHLPYFGVYGKLGPKKGTSALLRALARVKSGGLAFGLLLMAHPRPRNPHDYWGEAEALGLADDIVQIPFLPHWRVPEFIRRCLAVCCLEQDFPIGFHTPIIAREVLACGGCLVGSAEIVRKLPEAKLLAVRYNCVVVEDVEDTEALADRLAAILAAPEPAAEMGARGRAYVAAVQQDLDFPAAFERILDLVVSRRAGSAPAVAAANAEGEVGLTQLALATLSEAQQRELFAGAATDAAVAGVREAIRFEAMLARARAAREAGRTGEGVADALFRLDAAPWGVVRDQIFDLRPRLLTQLAFERFACDVTAFLDAKSSGRFPASLPEARTVVATRAEPNRLGDGPFILDPLEDRLVALSDGETTVRDIVDTILADPDFADRTPDAIVDTILHLFEIALLGLDGDR